MVASLAMYDPPELHWANDLLWQRWQAALQARKTEAPVSLARGQNWDTPDLLVAQTCGLPYALEKKWRLVATPCYRAEGCEGPRYRAALIARANDTRSDLTSFQGAIAAVNLWKSHSGHTALSEALFAISAPRPYFAEAVLSDSHLASMKLVASGRADIASIDCVTWELAKTTGNKSAQHLKVIGWTASAPGLPLVTARQQPDETVETIRSALQEAIADPALCNARDSLLITGIECLGESDYGMFEDCWKRAQSSPVAAS